MSAPTRVRGGVGLAFSAGFTPSPLFADFSPGLAADFGVTFAERYGLELRLAGGTTLSTLCVVASLVFEAALVDRVFLSAGFGVSAFGIGLVARDAAFVMMVVAPLRLSWLFAQFAPKQGFAFFLELAPGVPVARSGGRAPSGLAAVIPFGGVGSIGVTYSWK